MSNPTLRAPGLTPDDILAVAPVPAKYTKERITDAMWSPPGLTRRDRALITVTALIVRAQVIGVPNYVRKALDNGVTPAEISELVQVAFYADWEHAFAVIPDIKNIFAERGVGGDQLPSTEVAASPGASLARHRGAIRAASVHAGVRWLAGDHRRPAARPECARPTATVSTPSCRSALSPPRATSRAFAPGLDEYLKARLFGAVFARDNLDSQARELTTVGALSALDGVGPQAAENAKAALDRRLATQ